MKKTIYLDYNATAPMRLQVRELVVSLLDRPLNASSVHSHGREGKRLIDAARRQIAALCGADANNVIFNSGATEGNNTVLKHFSGQRILVSALEHPSVREARADAISIPATPSGLIDLAALEVLLKTDKTALVSAMLVNNETGIIQPVAEISKLARKYGAYFHCDAVQAAGRIPINLLELGIDFLTLSSHKIGGPQGVGALVLGLCGETPTLLDGGGQEKKARAGTENIAGIAGFGLAAALSLEAITSAAAPTFNAMLEKELRSISPTIKIYGCEDGIARVPNTTFFSLPGASSETLLMALDLDGICVSNGSACSSGTVKASHVLLAMGEDRASASAAIRVSSGWDTKESDIRAFLSAFEKIFARL